MASRVTRLGRGRDGSHEHHSRFRSITPVVARASFRAGRCRVQRRSIPGRLLGRTCSQSVDAPVSPERRCTRRNLNDLPGCREGSRLIFQLVRCSQAGPAQAVRGVPRMGQLISRSLDLRIVFVQEGMDRPPEVCGIPGAGAAVAARGGPVATECHRMREGRQGRAIAARACMLPGDLPFAE